MCGGVRVVPKDEALAELQKVLVDQRLAFVKKFGRDPAPGDAIFFDPERDVPTPAPLYKIPIDVIGAMLEAGLDEAEVMALLRAVT
jgi:hypothetical protein